MPLGRAALLRHALTHVQRASADLSASRRAGLLAGGARITFLKVSLLYLDRTGSYQTSLGRQGRHVWRVCSTLLVTFFSASVVVGVTTWLVTQVLAVPLRPLLLRPAFNAMKKRLRPFLLTTLAVRMPCAHWFPVMCIFPGILGARELVDGWAGGDDGRIAWSARR